MQYCWSEALLVVLSIGVPAGHCSCSSTPVVTPTLERANTNEPRHTQLRPITATMHRTQGCFLDPRKLWTFGSGCSTRPQGRLTFDGGSYWLTVVMAAIHSGRSDHTRRRKPGWVAGCGICNACREDLRTAHRIGSRFRAGVRLQL